MSIWWCNQAWCWHNERRAGVVCAEEYPEGSRNTFRRTVFLARGGDIVVHYRGRTNAGPLGVVAISRARGDAVHLDRLPPVSGANYHQGWRFETEYHDLHVPIPLRNFAQSVLPGPDRPVYYAITRHGDVMQGYFLSFTEAGLRTLLGHRDPADNDQTLPPWLQPYV
jgi:hypothetical protein